MSMNHIIYNVYIMNVKSYSINDNTYIIYECQ